MRKLIEYSQENLIECDHVNCGYVKPNPTKDPNVCIKRWINIPCPYCGSNLLTKKDYLDALKFMKIINWVNKWFSWITHMLPKKVVEGDVVVKFHNGVSIKEDT